MSSFKGKKYPSCDNMFVFFYDAKSWTEDHKVEE